jgi:hypothetical protein
LLRIAPKPNYRTLWKNLQFEELAKESGSVPAKHLTARVDLHTTSFAATFTTQGEKIFQPSKCQYQEQPEPVMHGMPSTFWNAPGLSEKCKLTLANATSAYYIKR